MPMPRSANGLDFTRYSESYRQEQASIIALIAHLAFASILPSPAGEKGP